MTTTTILDPVGVTGTTSLADLGAAVAAGHDQRVNVRVCNIGSADANADLYLVNGSNDHYRVKNFPVPYNGDGSAIDLEVDLLLPDGWKLQVRASAASTLAFSRTGVDRG